MTSTTSRDLQDRLALVTGAGQGIGAACARVLARRGAKVICTDLQDASAAKTAGALGGSAQSLALDVTDSAARGLAGIRLEMTHKRKSNKVRCAYVVFS
jgi:NAD(P)-dependent dehydrogenase (short-subunit alcohol dehydrogenase family)